VREDDTTRASLVNVPGSAVAPLELLVAHVYNPFPLSAAIAAKQWARNR